MKLLALLFLLVGQAFGQSSFIKIAAELSGKKPDQFAKAICDHPNDPVAERVLREYGALFIVKKPATPPRRCVFESETEVELFQADLKTTTATIGSTEITLQAEAMRAFLEAAKEATAAGLSITPRGGKIAGTRKYEDTVRLWNSRFQPALNHWQQRGRIARQDADAARALPAYKQVPIVLKWEESGMWFSTGFNRTILSSVAAPGTSQHLSGLAVDVTQFADARVRAILNRHGFFQTVADDTPHFTFLGRAEADLPKFGLISKERNGYKFWVPAIHGN